MLWVVCLHIILGLITSRGNVGVCYNASYVHLQATSWTVWL